MLRVNGLFAPGSFFSRWLSQYQSLNSATVGIEFVRRRGNLDVVVGIEAGFYGFVDANWLSSSPEKTPELDTHWAHFDHLTFLSFDVGVVYNYPAASWLSLSIGAGLGVGAILGDIFVINNTGAVNGGTCTAQNAANPADCYPVVNPSHYAVPPTYVDSHGMTRAVSGAIHLGNDTLDPDWQRKLDGLNKSLTDCLVGHSADLCKDTAGHPYYHAAGEKPPATIVINLLVGFKFHLHPHVNFNLRAGFRNGLVFGGGPEYVF